MTELEKILIRRDGMTPQEARQLVDEMRERVFDGEEDPEEILHEIGLEPDYVFDILW